MKVRVIAEYNMKDCKIIKFNPQTRTDEENDRRQRQKPAYGWKLKVFLEVLADQKTCNRGDSF